MKTETRKAIFVTEELHAFISDEAEKEKRTLGAQLEVLLANAKK